LKGPGLTLRGPFEIHPVTVVRDLLTALVAIGATVQLTSGASRAPSPARQTQSGNQSSGNVTAIQTADPAAVVFTTGTGLVLHAVKPASVPDYEATMVALQDAFAKSSDDHVKRVSAGWRVWKAAEPDAKGNVVYVHTLQPTTAGVDYRPSLWLDQLLSGAPAELLAKYRDAFAVSPSKLSLTELANMSVAPTAPTPPAHATPNKPGNSSPQ
jgi:hypothetical protein